MLQNRQTRLIDFIQNAPLKTFDRGEILLSEGDSPKKLFAIQRGFIKVTALNENGSQQLLWIAGRCDLAPAEMFFSLSGVVQYFYTAYTDMQAYEVDKADFLEFVKTDFDLMTEVAHSMSGHYDNLLKRVHSVEQTVVRDKIVHTLYDLARRFSTADSVDLFAVGLRLTHQDIADMVGASRETASIELHKLRSERYIVYSRKNLIINVRKLSTLIASGAPQQVT